MAPPLDPALAHALAEAQPLTAARGWQPPLDAAVAQAQRLLVLVHRHWRAPTGVEVEPDGAVCLDWDAGARGWLQLRVRGDGKLVHSAVIEGEEYGQTEDFAEVLPPWAEARLRRLLLVGH